MFYCGEENYQYLPKIIEDLEDKLPDHEDFNKPDPDTTQWAEEKAVPLLDGNVSAIIVDKGVQIEKKMVVNRSKKEVGMAKWSKKYNRKMEYG